MKQLDASPSERRLRVGRTIQETLAEVLRSDVLHDPELREVNVTILEVRASPDLRRADVYVLPFGEAPRDEAERIVGALNRAGSFLGGETGRRARLRFAPRLHFVIDDTLERASRIDSLLAGDGD